MKLYGEELTHPCPSLLCKEGFLIFSPLFIARDREGPGVSR